MTRRLTTALMLGLLLTTACSDEPESNNTTPDMPTTNPDMPTTDPDMPDGINPVDMGDMDVPDGMNPGDMDPDMPPVTSERVVCPTAIPAAPAGQLCSVTPGSADKLLIQATVLAGDKIYENGAVLVDRSDPNGKIMCVGCDCAPAGATVLSCADGVLSPGLINAHDHMPYNVKGTPKGHGTERFDHRHDWRTGARGHTEVRNDGSSNDNVGRQFAELRMLLSGTTSLVGSGGTPGFVRNLDVSTQDGGLNAGEVDYRTFPLGDTSGALRTSGCSYGTIDQASRLNARIYLPHIAEGIDKEANNEYKCLSGGTVDLIASNTSVIHGIGLTAGDIADMSARGAKLVWSPRTNIDLYGQTADVMTYRRMGVNIALGTDWIISGSMNMLRELQCVDNLNKNNYGNAFTDYEIWHMATAGGAVAMGVEDRLGSIKTNYIADLALYDGSTNADYRAIIDAGMDEVALVMRGGRPLYGDATILTGLVAAGDAAKCEPMDVCGRGKTLCAELDTNSNLATITAAGSSYPLFFCGQPMNEPSCVPARPNEYTGVATATDKDGDGIDDAQDSCSAQFNPKRPLDDGKQPNFDGDAAGDACDVCPLNEGATCSMIDPSDRDADGVPNEQDNCPTVPNMDQMDGDGDMIGDACDKCPAEANANSPCTASIYDIKQKMKWTTGDTIRIKDVLVIGSGKDGIFIQAREGTPGYNGVNYSGLFVFDRGATKPAQGDVIDLTGTLTEFSGQIQLTTPTNVMVASQNNPLPAPTVLTSAELKAPSTRGPQLESTLVQLEGVTVSSFSAMYAETTLNNGDALIDDVLFSYDPPPVGTTLDIVRGPLSVRTTTYRVNPRDANDLVVDQNAPRVVASLAPATLNVPPSQTRPLTINLNLPAQVGGMVVTLSATPAGVVTIPASVTIPEGSNSAQIMVTAGAAEAMATISASVAGQSPAIMGAVNVTTLIAECLIFSEYVEGSSNNKAFELYNCGSAPVDLASYVFCQANNANTTCSAKMSLTGTIAPGDVFVACNTSIAAGATCDVKPSSSVMNFNGDDRLFIVKDENGNATADANEPIIDAFGQISMQPATSIWADKTYRRCNFSPFLGDATFDVLAFFSDAGAKDLFDNLGVAPTEGCP
jgi:large repetitive protein